MKQPNLGRKSSRHPAVIDLLGGTPTGDVPPGTPTTGAVPGGPAKPLPTAARRTRGPSGGRRQFVKTAAAMGMAAAIVAAVVVANDQMREDNPDPTHAAMTAAAPTDENGLPTLNLPEPERVEEPEAAGDGECRADRGDQKSGAGVIAAFNHAYYSQRNGEAARALATPTSSVQPAPLFWSPRSARQSTSPAASGSSTLSGSGRLSVGSPFSSVGAAAVIAA